VNRPDTLVWLASHELRLSWRDWLSLMTAGRRTRARTVTVALIVFAALMHLLAYSMVGAYAGALPDKATLVTVTGCILLSWSLLLSQAMESVTRAFYARSDLDLILASPVSARKVFSIRIARIGLSVALIAMLLAAPFIDVLAWLGGARWLAAYGVVAAMGALAAALAVALTVALFRTIGAKRTRLVAQIVAAVIGASCVIGLQVVAILSYGSLSRFAPLQSEWLIEHSPDIASAFWWPARAVLGDSLALLAVMAVSLTVLGASIAIFSVRFGDHVMAAAGISGTVVRQNRASQGFRRRSAARALRHKEWTLLRRDPWLVSQTLMQMLYLLPPALMLWISFRHNSSALVVLVPVVVMAAGQLAGGLAWLSISGEDTPNYLGQDRSGDGHRRLGVRAVDRRARLGVAGGCAGGERRRADRGRGVDANSALLPRAGAPQPIPPPPDLVAHSDLCRSVLVHRLGGNRRASRGRNLVCAVPGRHRHRNSRRRPVDQS